MILLIDNYDTGLHDLYQSLQEIGADVQVVRNDDTALEDIFRMQPEALIFSSGTGLPKDTGWCTELIRYFCGKIPILGIGLGALTIAAYFGAASEKAVCGTQESSFNIGFSVQSGLFQHMQPVTACKAPYSWTVRTDALPEKLQMTARDQYGQMAAFAHTDHPVYGVLFRPEALAEHAGNTLLENFVQLASSEKTPASEAYRSFCSGANI